ncbi:Adenylosuccinate lyase [Handroanthus impetiginosus]|uniref:Adenylosuccinate lyase n=1 Tax=Handroanthus impetiginosus TaxID=429701 RepID=A0A2G9G9E6_9LAMI|nr:Adenylosuccinate lyase [Handroanthus impetiginosus]
MELAAGVRRLSLMKTAPCPTQSNHIKSGNLYSDLTSLFVSFRTRRNPAWKGYIKKNSSSTKSELKVNMKSLSNYSSDDELSSLTSLCPLDGPYWDKLKDLSPFMSEFALTKSRVVVQIRWLLKLSQISEVHEVPRFSEEVESYLHNLSEQFNMDDALEVKKIEKVTNDDVKAVEYFLKQKCQSNPEISKVLEFFHFACTSEDINNLAYALMIKEAINKVILPVVDKLIAAISNMAAASASTPLLCQIPGQPASPTTVGKEMAFFAYRLSRERNELSETEILGRLAGAVGNYNLHRVACPDVNWPRIADELVTSLGIRFNPDVTQNCQSSSLSRSNYLEVKFDRDIRGYISSGHFKQITKVGEIGSSMMPLKVNSIHFKSSEGDCGVANGILMYLSKMLPISFWQRDLIDSTVTRNIGAGLAHSLMAYKRALQGIAELQVDEASMIADLD